MPPNLQAGRADVTNVLPRLGQLNDATPHCRLLSNGRYSVLITGAGTGYSAFDGLALTAWNADRIEDGDGFFIYLHDVDRGTFWSIGHQPVQKPAERYEVTYQPGVLTIARLDDEIEVSAEIFVSPHDDIEIRTVRLTNNSPHPRRIELTSYAEIVLNDPAAHAAHPAFSKLFVETAFLAQAGVLLAKRRPRSATERVTCMFHVLLGGESLQCETDRSKFVGRGRTLACPRALSSHAQLSGSVGSVLDPVTSLRSVVALGPHGNAQLSLLLGTAATPEAACKLVMSYSNPGATTRARECAVADERALLERLEITAEQAEMFQELAGAVLYGLPDLRARGDVLKRVSGRRATEIEHYGLDGSKPLIVARADGEQDRDLLRDLCKAHAFWTEKGLAIDLVVLHGGSQPPAGQERSGAEWVKSEAATRRKGKLLFLPVSEIPRGDIDLLATCAACYVSDCLPVLVGCDRPTPDSMSGAGSAGHFRPPVGDALQLADKTEPTPTALTRPRALELHHFNGYGGFAPGGSEYVILLDPSGASSPFRPPMPWVNVVANEEFGFLVSESGAGYTWSRNSRENRLTPWYNDPITDPHGEAFYVRDEDAGLFWSPTPGPVPSPGSYEVRHGFGYTLWRHTSHELEQEFCLFVTRRDPVKIARLRLKNTSGSLRRLSVFSYHRLVLGSLPTRSACSVLTEFDTESAAILARNPLNGDFAGRVVFGAVLSPEDTRALHYTCDRAGFIGRNGSPARPQALCSAVTLDGKVGDCLDPCLALQVRIEIAPGDTVECAFLLGEDVSPEGVRALVERYRRPGSVQRALDEVKQFWAHAVSALQVQTPSPAIDVMVNGWLLYQDLSCRLWGRSAFYQSGGAFGFRDQLQDAAALVYSRPDLTRHQILLHAAHQFVEGDVLHWWHPPEGRGIRTRFSDDLLWLPFMTSFYVNSTGDWSVLEESIGFLWSRPLSPGEDEAYLLPQPAGESADLYAHCCRALDRSLTRGAHGLPLMGTGDWNDGMNRVGREGRGESVWMGFFLYAALDEFIPLCERRGDRERVQRYRGYRAALHAALDSAGWDGQWYRRAYYDDGTPLGSALNEECRIDALAQAWAVISHAAPRRRAEQAMDSVERQLVSDRAGMIRLLDPPFDRTAQDPGYIKGYVPGIRENGGQYTHAALWVVRALAELGRRDRAATLLAELSPVSHALTADAVSIYQVEPYVVAADVYGAPPHVGRGGWTWYTGSAGWMLRVALESVLGLTLTGGDTLWLRPCIPDDWGGFLLTYRLPDGKTRYQITVRNPHGRAEVVKSVLLDSKPGSIAKGRACVPLRRDGKTHQVVVMLGGKGKGN